MNHTELIIPEGETVITSASFMNNATIRSVYIPDSVRIIEDNAFYACVNLETVRMSGNVERVEANSFANCYSLKEMTLPDTLTYIGESAFYYCKNLRKVNIPVGVTVIEDRTFSGCEKLESVYIPDGVRSIGPKSFNYCTSLTHLRIPGSVETIGSEAFMRCGRLPGLVIEEGVRRIEGWAFAHCEVMKTLTLPRTLTYIGDHAFYDCGMNEIDIPGSVGELRESVFADCGWLTGVTIGDGIRSVDTHAFWKCYNLESIAFPGSVERIGVKAFRECLALKVIWMWGRVRSMDRAFELSYDYNAGTIYAPRVPIDDIPEMYKASAMNGFEDSFRIGLDMSEVKESYAAYIRRYKNVYYTRAFKEMEWLRLLLREGIIEDEELPDLIARAAKGGYVEASAALLEHQSKHTPPQIDYGMFELP